MARRKKTQKPQQGDPSATKYSANATWTKVATARAHGWNVRQAGDRWEVAELSLAGWIWKEIRFPSKAAALRVARVNWHASLTPTRV